MDQPDTTITERKRLTGDLIAAAVLLIVVLILLRGTLGMRQTFYTMDVARQNYPIQHHFTSAVRDGRLPLWTSQLWGGFPLYAEGQGGLFYPGNLPFYIRPMHVGMNLYILLHTFLAGLFLYWFARTADMSPPAALLAAGAYALSSLIHRHHGILNHFAALTWLPVPLALLNHWVKRRGVVWALLGGLALGVQWLAGHPQFSWMTHLALGGLVVFHVAGRNLPSLRDKGAALAVVAAMVVIGVGLAGIQLVPMQELTRFSERSGGVPCPDILGSGLHCSSYFDLLSPGYWGRVDGATALDDLDQRAILYVGVLPLLLVPLAFRRGRRSWAVGFLVLALVGVLLTLEDNQAVSRLLAWGPPANLFRYRSRYAVFLVLGVVLLAGRGLDALLRPQTSRPARSGKGFAYGYAGALLLLGAACAIGLYAVRDGLLPNAKDAGIPADLAAAKLQAIRDVRGGDLVHLIVFWGIGAATLLACLLRMIGRRVTIALVIVQLAANLLLFGVEKPSLIDSDYYTRSPRTREVMAHEPEPFRVFAYGETPPNPYDGDGFNTWSDDNRVSYQYYSELLATDLSLLHKVDNAFGFSHSLLLARYWNYVYRIGQTSDLKLLGLLNVKYFLSVMSVDVVGLEPVLHDKVHVYRNRQWLPRAMLVHSVAPAADRGDAFRKLIELDPTRCAVVEGWAPPVPPPGGTEGPDTVRIVEYSDMHVEIAVRASQQGLLVLADTYYPGWEAAVDGVPAHIYRTNYLFRGVLVGPGEHRVTFDYRPASFRRGAWISGGALAAVLVGLLGCAWRRVSSARRAGDRTPRQSEATSSPDAPDVRT